MVLPLAQILRGGCCESMTTGAAVGMGQVRGQMLPLSKQATTLPMEPTLRSVSFAHGAI